MSTVELVSQWTPESGQPHRVVFTTDTHGWLRIETRWTGTRWREVGCERVSEVSVKCKCGETTANTPTGATEVIDQ